MSESTTKPPKRCADCGETRPLTEFHRLKNGAHYSYCKDCKADQSASRRYGIPRKWYLAKVQEQGGLCAICGKTCPTGRRLAVDHNHSTGAPRALLCANCNQGLGKFMDSSTLLRVAADYLEAHGGEG